MSEIETSSAASRIETVSEDDYVMIGNQRVAARDVLAAYGGTLNVGWSAPPARKFGNPTPMGLCGFASSTFVLSMIKCGALGVTIPNIVIGLAFFHGGLVQFIAGMWEFVMENTFGATALSVYGMFWMSFAALLTPAFGVEAAFLGYAKQAGMSAEEGIQMMDKAIGLYLVCWAIFTLMLSVILVKSTVALFTLFFSVFIAFLLLAIGSFTGSAGCTRAGGVFGVIAGFLAWGNALAGLVTKESSYFSIKPVYLPGGGPPKTHSHK